MTGGAVTSSSPLVMFFSLFSLNVIFPATRKIKLKNKKQTMMKGKRQTDDTHFDEWFPRD